MKAMPLYTSFFYLVARVYRLHSTSSVAEKDQKEIANSITIILVFDYEYVVDKKEQLLQHGYSI